MKKNASKRSLHIHMCEDSPQGPSMECMNGSRLHEEGCIQAREVCIYTCVKTHLKVLPWNV